MVLDLFELPHERNFRYLEKNGVFKFWGWARHPEPVVHVLTNALRFGLHIAVPCGCLFVSFLMIFRITRMLLTCKIIVSNRSRINLFYVKKLFHSTNTSVQQFHINFRILSKCNYFFKKVPLPPLLWEILFYDLRKLDKPFTCIKSFLW